MEKSTINHEEQTAKTEDYATLKVKGCDIKLDKFDYEAIKDFDIKVMKRGDELEAFVIEKKEELDGKSKITKRGLGRVITKWPKVTHVNGDKFDYRRSNLKTKSSPYVKGISKSGKFAFKSVINFNNKNYNLGIFDSELECEYAIDVARKILSRGNFSELDMIHTNFSDYPDGFWLKIKVKLTEKKKKINQNIGVYEVDNRSNGHTYRRYRSFVTINGKQMYVGQFNTEEEAVDAHDYAVRFYQQGHKEKKENNPSKPTFEMDLMIRMRVDKLMEKKGIEKIPPPPRSNNGSDIINKTESSSRLHKESGEQDDTKVARFN